MTNVISTISNTIKNWWIPALVGVLFIVMGVSIFMNPNEAYEGLALVFSISLLAVGILEIIFSISNREVLQGWGWLLTLGILTAIVGVLLLQNPDVSNALFPFYISFLLLFRSLMGISTSLDMKSYGILDWGNVMLISVLAAILSMLMIFNPNFAGVAITFWTAIVFILLGVFSLLFGFRLRKIKRTPQRIERNVKNAVSDAQKDVKKGVKNLKNNLNDAVDNAKDNVNNAVNTAKDKLDDAADNLRNNADS